MARAPTRPSRRARSSPGSRTRDLNLYASYSEGFKGGGFDPRGNFANADVREGFLPETVESYELGAKTSFFDGRATINTAVFFADYTDVQIPGSLVLPGPPVSFVGTVTNAGAAEMKGVEVESAFQFTDSFSAPPVRRLHRRGVHRVPAQRRRRLVAARRAEHAGLDRQRQPRPTACRCCPASSGSRLRRPIAARRSSSRARRPASTSARTGCYDASVNWTSDDDRWQLGLHGRNLSDERYVTSGYYFPGRPPTTRCWRSTATRAPSR